jgi:hypothetical protein
MPHQRDWIDYLVAFAPFVAICVAVSVALMQAHLQRLNLKQALYDRRFTVRQHLLELHSKNIKTNGELDDETLSALTLSVQHAQNLFGSDVTDFMITFGDNMVKANQKRQEANTANMAGTLTTELMRESNDAMSVSFRDYMHITEVFKPYLKLHDDKSWLARFASRLNRWVNEEVPEKMKSSRYPS